MSVFVQYVPHDLHDGPWTPAMKRITKKTCSIRSRKCCPGFRNLMLHVQMRTPWDIENEVGITEGNIFQGELTLDQLLFNRPFPGMASIAAPSTASISAAPAPIRAAA